jgi:putative serine protease PepD
MSKESVYAGQPVTSPGVRRRRRTRIVPALAGVAVVSAVFGGVGALAVQHEQLPAHPAVTAAAPASPASSAPPNSVEQVAAKVVPSVVELETHDGDMVAQGSGIILSSDGLILTNNHVVAPAADAAKSGDGQIRAQVIFSDGRTSPFTVVGTDPTTDIAVVRAQGVSGLTPLARRRNFVSGSRSSPSDPRWDWVARSPRVSSAH